MANFKVQKQSTFTVCLPFNCTDEEFPQLVFGTDLSQLPSLLKAVPEEALQYFTCTFRTLDFGTDCLIKELAHFVPQELRGIPVPERVLSESRLNTIRLKYLLVKTNLLPAEEPLQFIQEEGRQVLTPESEALVAQLNPQVLGAYLTIAGTVWDYGVNPKHLLTPSDYQIIRDQEDGLQKVRWSKGIRTSAEREKEAAEKKAAGNASSLPSS